jgi:predicted membrane protein
MKVNVFLDKLRIPFWCIFAVILALEVTASILRGTDFNFQVFLIVMGICYIILGLACAIFYVIIGVKLTRALQTVSKEVVISSKTRRLNRVSHRKVTL